MKNLLKSSLAVAVASCLFGISSEAAAGPLDFDRDSFFIVTGERLFGFDYSSTKTDVTAGNTTTTRTDKATSFSLLSPSGNNPYNAPSVGLHYSVIPALTIGAQLGLVRSSSTNSSEANGKTVESDGPTSSGFLFAPRIGYIIGPSNAFYIWARGGITYFQGSSSIETSTNNVVTKSENTRSGLALSIDPMFVVTPVNRFGIMFGPVLDLGLSGKDKTETTTGSTTNSQENDSKITNFGFQFGLLGYI